MPFHFIDATAAGKDFFKVLFDIRHYFFIVEINAVIGKKYLDNFTGTLNKSTVIPYAGGPEIKEPLCRNINLRIIQSAKEKLYRD